MLRHAHANRFLQDPNAQLESLRRHSLIGPSDLQLPNQKSIPQREMPTSSARVDPGTLGHPVALTRGPEDAPASQPANGSAVQTSRGVSFAAAEDQASEAIIQEKAASIPGAFFSVPDFAQSTGELEEEVLSPSEAGPSAAANSVQEPAV
jgi:hypothetical protein